LQIAGRAGRYGTAWETGFVTTFKHEDLKPLTQLLGQTPDEILQAGLHPTFDQLELYAYHLPKASLSNLVDIFISLSTLDDSLYTLCHLDDFKFLADMIEHIKLPLKAKYTFCCAPINRKMPLVCTMFLKMARQYSKGELVNFDWLCSQLGWPFSPPETILDLVHLEAVHDSFDLFLWLSYRFPDMFVDTDLLRQVQQELDIVIQHGVSNIVELLKNAENKPGLSSGNIDEDTLEAKRRKMKVVKNSWTHKDANMAKTESEQKQKREEKKNLEGLSDNISGLKVDTDKKQGAKPGTLTNQLLQQGIVTQKMIKQLKRELNDADKYK